MAPRIIVETYRVEGCPLYPIGGGMVFREQAVGGIDPHPACSIAVEKFRPILKKIAKGRRPESFSGEPCGGCDEGKAWFRFRSEHVEPLGTISAMSQEARAALMQSRVFQGMGPGMLGRAMPLFEEVTLPPGAMLIEKNGAVEGLYVIVIGKFEILQPDDAGNFNVVAEVGPGDCLGEISMITGDRASASVRAKTDARLVMVHRDRIPDLMSLIPTLPGRLAHILANRLIQTSRKFQEEISRGLKGRLDAISPSELVQTLAVSNLSGMLRVTHEGREMMMYFHEGKLGTVQLEEKQGEDAFYDFLDWVRGDFSFEPGRHELDTSARRIDPTGLLLEGMRRKDETQRITRDQMPTITPPSESSS